MNPVLSPDYSGWPKQTTKRFTIRVAILILKLSSHRTIYAKVKQRQLDDLVARIRVSQINDCTKRRTLNIQKTQLDSPFRPTHKRSRNVVLVGEPRQALA